LLGVLSRLVDQGNTVLVIEHNLDVVKTADWIVDLGPEGGDGGGTVVVEGPPELVAKTEASYRGPFCRRVRSAQVMASIRSRASLASAAVSGSTVMRLTTRPATSSSSTQQR